MSKFKAGDRVTHRIYGIPGTVLKLLKGDFYFVRWDKPGGPNEIYEGNLVPLKEVEREAPDKER